MAPDEVVIENRRFDAADNEDLIGISRRFAAAFGYTAELNVDAQLAELLRLRVSQINNCTYCMNLHYEEARALGIPRAKIDTLSAWWETALFSEAEQAALDYTEALTRIADTTVADGFQRHHEELAGHFDPAQVIEIAAVVINMNVWTRLKLAEGATPTTPQRRVARG
jgi:AhpD family alkylhydroperoxidase